MRRILFILLVSILTAPLLMAQDGLDYSLNFEISYERFTMPLNLDTGYDTTDDRLTRVELTPTEQPVGMLDGNSYFSSLRTRVYHLKPNVKLPTLDASITVTRRLYPTTYRRNKRFNATFRATPYCPLCY